MAKLSSFNNTSCTRAPPAYLHSWIFTFVWLTLLKSGSSRAILGGVYIFKVDEEFRAEVALYVDDASVYQ
jgi:hypothetical protein